MGALYAPPVCGCSRADLSKPLDFRVPSWCVPAFAKSANGFAATAFPERRRGGRLSFPPDSGRRLPAGYSEFRTFKDLTVPFDGSMEDAFAEVTLPDGQRGPKLAGYINLSNDFDAPLSGGPEEDTLMLALQEQLLQNIRESYQHGALDAVSTPCLPKRPTAFLVRDDATGKWVPKPVGLRQHSQEVYPALWDEGKQRLRKALIYPWTPLPCNSLSLSEGLVVALHLREHALSGDDVDVTGGDDRRRTFYSGDLGSEHINLSLVDRGIARVWRASLRPGDADYERHYEPFPSAERAEQEVAALRQLLVNDPVPAPMHNDMVTTTTLLMPHVVVAALEQIRIFLRFPAIMWAGEGKQYRPKKQLLRITSAAHHVVHTKRLHTQGSWLAGVKVRESGGEREGGGGAGASAADGSEGHSFGGFDEASYVEQHTKMVESTNKDGEMAVLNHFVLDLLVAHKLDKRARSYGLTRLH